MNRNWKPNTISRRHKIAIFPATIESIQLYGPETWNMSKSFSTSLDACYSKLLCYALKISWTHHITQVYQELPRISNRLQSRRHTFAGHIFFLLHFPTRSYLLGQGNRLTYLEKLLTDTDYYKLN